MIYIAVKMSILGDFCAKRPVHSCLMSSWCFARQTQHIVYVMFVMFSKHYLVDIGSQCERVAGNGLLFIKRM